MTRRRQVFVAGTWDAERAEVYAEQARTVGRLLAEAGCDLACGPGTGISAHAIAGFRTITPRAGRVRFYLPAAEHMTAVGEQVRHDLADEVVQTELDYPTRNVHQVRQCGGLIVVTGGDGTLEEVLPALIDYGMPVGILARSGKAAVAVERIAPLFPEWAPLLRFADTPDELVAFVLDQLSE